MTDLLIPPLDDTPPPNIEVHRGPPTRKSLARPSIEFQSQRFRMLSAPAKALMTTPTPEAVLAFFQDNDGTREVPDGSNRCFVTDWWRWYDAWCFMAASMALNRAGFATDEQTTYVPGVEQTHAKGWAYCPAGARCFDDAGMFSSTPMLGSLGIAVWVRDGWRDPTWDMPGDHVCVVYATLDAGGRTIPWKDDRTPADPDAVASVVCWDGNISNRIITSHRSASTYYGYCHVPYPNVAKPKTRRRKFVPLFTE